jgi:hypothetical protein
MKRSILSGMLSLVFVGGLYSPANAAQNAYYVDNTQHYPVYSAAQHWSRNGHIILVEVNSCREYSPCVNVSEWRSSDVIGGNNVAGWADPGTKGIGLIYHYKNSLAYRFAAICHEFGHYLGVGHSSHGCMKAYIKPNIQNWVGKYNLGKAQEPSIDWN